MPKSNYGFGRATIVLGRQGHLLSTIWIPLASFKAVRLGPWRFQRCPVGRHWTLVRPVNVSAPSPEQLQPAEVTRDVRIP
jgi:hypothetical protein